MKSTATIRLGGSEFGGHFWSSIQPCTMKFHLTQKRRAELESGAPVYRDPEKPLDKLDAMMVGSIGHGILEHWYTRGAMPEEFQFESGEIFTSWEPELEEAIRVCEGYIDFYKTENLKVVGVEHDLSDTSGVLGIPNFTGRADLIFEHEGGVMPGTSAYLPPGLYLMDHKFVGQTPSVVEMAYRVQLWGYQMLWNKENPGRRVLGALINNCIKTKTPKFARQIVKPPTEREMELVQETFTNLNHLHQTLPIARNLFACFEFPDKRCPFQKECLNAYIE